MRLISMIKVELLVDRFMIPMLPEAFESGRRIQFIGEHFILHLFACAFPQSINSNAYVV